MHRYILTITEEDCTGMLKVERKLIISARDIRTYEGMKVLERSMQEFKKMVSGNFVFELKLDMANVFVMN